MTHLKERMPREQRGINKRIIVQGTLVLDTPTLLGSGDNDAPTDIAVQRDSISNRALLTGSSLAGALRAYLAARHAGFSKKETSDSPIQQLLGGVKGDDDGSQSSLIICDARSIEEHPMFALRDGVRIDSGTRTPVPQGKYDMEMLAAGTCFPLRFELAIGQGVTDEQEMRTMLAAALSGLQQGDIGLGMKKQRGYGRGHVKLWQVWEFDLRVPQEMLRWLAFKRDFAAPYDTPVVASHTDITAALKAGDFGDQRQRVTLRAQMSPLGSLIIRSGQDTATTGPDVRHLHAHNAAGQSHPVLSGTSLAGVLRHRSERIVNTLADGNEPNETDLVNGLFGYVKKGNQADSAMISRVVVYERAIETAINDRVQNRIAIDRFTGGAYDGALFNEQPVIATADTRVEIAVDVLDDPKPGEIGLLLLLLKDLWSSDLPVGGESSIGRGRLQGNRALVERHNGGEHEVLAEFVQEGAKVRLVQGTPDALNGYVTELCNVVRGANQ
jgi:CRISPR/Cas system CSM-associated protein Csm3 (group 7 of RAMP superfamily)